MLATEAGQEVRQADGEQQKAQMEVNTDGVTVMTTSGVPADDLLGAMPHFSTARISLALWLRKWRL